MVQNKIRLKFQKVGKLKFISHLDLIRTMKGAFLRAGIPIYYTEGFNPRPKMVFALPLSIGCESLCEYLDIKLLSPMDEIELLSKLNAQFPPELKFTEVYERNTEFTQIAKAHYRITVKNSIPEDAFREAMTGEISVTKKSKKGMVNVDISKNVFSYQISAQNDMTVIDVYLSSKPDSYANPEHLIKGIADKLGVIIDDYDIMRVALYGEDGKEFK